MTVIHDFDVSLARGKQGEAFLDRYFARDYDITPATRDEQRRGIDRHFVFRASGRHWLVEYKTDYRACETGNAVVETTSVSTAGKAGWAYTSQAQHLCYYCPGPNAEVIYLISLARLRRNVPAWLRDCRTFAAANDGYETRGILVPLAEFERIALAVLPADAAEVP